MKDNNQSSRWKFIQQSTLAGGGLVLANAVPIFSNQETKATEINDAWEKVVNKETRYRYVIDAATF